MKRWSAGVVEEQHLRRYSRHRCDRVLGVQGRVQTSNQLPADVAAGRCCGIAESAAVQPAPTRSNAGCTGHSSCVTGTEETSTWQQQLSGRSSRQQSNHLAKGKIDIKEFSGKRSENIDECWVVDREMSVGDGVTPLPQREGLRRGTRVRKHGTCGSV